MVVPYISKTFTKVFGSRNARLVKSYRRRIGQINEFEGQVRHLTDSELRAQTEKFRNQIADRKSIRDIQSEALAVAREVMDRAVGIRNIFNPEGEFDPRRLPQEIHRQFDEVKQQIESMDSIEVEGSVEPVLAWQQVDIPVTIYEAVRVLYPKSRPPYRARPFDVQLIGGTVLSEGRIAEMKTGEGKTIVAPLACYLACLENLRCHVVTVNDFLVQRDRDWVFPFYFHLGLTVGAIHPIHAENSEEYNRLTIAKQQAYGCDVLYGTNSELGFDYLRDNMKLSAEEQLQRRREFCIIDEVDSILIDEARTPLIISGPAHDDAPRYDQADAVARHLMQKQRGWDAANTKVEAIQMRIKGVEGDIRNARDKDMIPKLRDEIKNLTDQLPQLENERSQHIQYFEVEREKKASHLTHEGVSEAQKQAGIGSFYVGNNMDFPHLLENALRAHAVYQKDKDYVVQNGDVVIVDEFTGRLMIGRQWSDGLHQAVEAKEQVKIKQETQTLATVTIQNFFKLYKRLAGMTGTAITEATEFNEIYGLDVVCIPTNATVVRHDRDDLIYLSQKDKWDAILDEIKSNHDMGRPVLVGTTSVEKSERLSEMLTRKYSIAHEVLNAKQHEREAHIVEHAGELGAVMIATNMAGRGTDIRLAQVGRSSLVRHWQQRNLLPKKASVEASNEELAMLSYRHQAGQQLGLKGKELDALGDDEVRLRLLRRWCTEQTLLDSEKIEKASITFCERALDNVPGFVRHRMEIYDRIEQMGGLHIVGTERHEARRIDNQLRGRSGRQGDQGSSRFFIALDDDLMQLFAKGWLMKALPKMGMKEGDAIEHRWITKSVERAQRKVEERNYEIRKNLLEYDEVMEHQRNAFYSIRQKVLDGEDIEQIIFGYISEAVEDACDQYLDVDYIPTQVAEWCRQNLDVSVDASKLRIGDLSDLKNQVRSEARAEARQALEVTLGEYMSDDIPQENWDLRNLSRWAMSRFSVDLKQSHLRQMNIDAVTEVLTEAADEQIEKKELSGVAKFLEPLYAANDLAEWAQQKFEINIKAESLAPQQGEKSADTKRRVVEIVLDEAISAYRRRQVTYPVDFVLDMVGQIAQQDRTVAAEQLARWANQRFELDWQAESIVEQEFPVLRQQLIDESEQWHHNGRLDSVVDQAIAEQNGDPVELSKWVQNRFGQVASKEDLMGLDRDALRAILLDKGQAMLRTELTQLERFVLLQILDMAWKDHLYVMDQIKDSVSLRGYAEKDPRIEYKREGANQFLQMQKTVRDRVTELIFRARLTPNVESRSVYSQQEARHADVGDLLSDSATAAAGTQQQREDLEAAERAGAEQSTAPRSRRQRRAAAAEKLNDGKPVRAKSEFKRRKKRSR